MNGTSDIPMDGTLGRAPHHEATHMHQYRVERGDSPAIIARKYGVSTGSLLAANPAKPAHAVAGTMTWRSLAIGETVNVPARHGLHGEFGLAGGTTTDVSVVPSKNPVLGAIVTNLDWSPIGGDINFSIDGNFVGAASLTYLSAGRAVAGMTLGSDLSPGNHTVVAVYSGDTSNDASASAGFPFSVGGGGGGGGGGGYSTAIVAAAQALDAQLVARGCCGCGDTGSVLSAAIHAFKQAILVNPSDWGSPGAYHATTVTGSGIDVTNTQCQAAMGNGTIADLRAVLGSNMRYPGGPCSTWNSAGNCPCVNTGTNCGPLPPQTYPCPAGTAYAGQQVANILTDCGGQAPPATIACPPGTVKEGQQVANILTDCGGVALPCPQGTVREGQPIGMDPTCGGQKPGVTKCPAGTVREGKDVGTDTACGGSSLPCAPGTVRENQAIGMDPLCGGLQPKVAKDEACPAGQIRQGGQCIKAPSSGGGGGSNAALIAGGLIVVGGIAATVFAMRKRKS